MSRKTKAELEAENTELLAENLKLWGRIEEMDGQLDDNYRLIKKLRINFDKYRKQSDVRPLAKIVDRMFEQVMEIEPEIRKEERSRGGKHAINARWGIEGWKVEKVKGDYDAIKKELGPGAKNKTVCRRVSELIFHHDKSWRIIDRLIKKK